MFGKLETLACFSVIKELQRICSIWEIIQFDFGIL